MPYGAKFIFCLTMNLKCINWTYQERDRKENQIQNVVF